MHKMYKTRSLDVQSKKDLCIKAKEICSIWWVDQLDCKISFARQKIEMSFDDILAKLTMGCHFVVIHRQSPFENHLEVGFSTMGKDVDYFLWINVPTARTGFRPL